MKKRRKKKRKKERKKINKKKLSETNLNETFFPHFNIKHLTPGKLKHTPSNLASNR